MTLAWASKTLTGRVAGAQHVLAGLERFAARGMHLDVALPRLADDKRAHQGGVVVPVDAGELQRQLVALDSLRRPDL
jgi:hypothetical protein